MQRGSKSYRKRMEDYLNFLEGSINNGLNASEEDRES
jgi:hypothetical protein